MKFKFTVLLMALVLCNSSYAWENKLTHPAITQRAVESNTAIDDYLKNQLGLSGSLSTQLYWNFPQDIENRIKAGKADPGNKTRTILEWLRTGSNIEDMDGIRAISWRSRHHFHDPTRNAGLDNHADHPDWDAPGWSSWLPLGQSALNWAITGTAVQEPTTNNNRWENARTAFYDALTKSSKSDRDASLAETFLNLGNVIHLLEDMGVPAHTRNDFLFGHYRTWTDYGNDLENNIEKRVSSNKGQSLWSGTSPVIFDTVAKYFDTDTRDANSYPGLPLSTWGLSECTNYQFLSLSTIFIPNDGSRYYFPHPDINNMGTAIIEDQKTYFNGVNYGVSHMARESYTFYKSKNELYNLEFVDNKNTTDDEKVFIDYANITIPRTIDYVTGLANYFFRGKLDVEAHCTQTAGVAQITITNKSMNGTVEQALKGGDFELYAYRHNGQAIPITLTLSGWNNGILAYGDSLTGDFNIPSLSYPIAHYYGVVYKGQIVPNNDTGHVDPNDPHAIAYGRTVPKAVLYFTNCAAGYQSNPSYFDADLADFRASCNDVKVGFYYTPIQWFPQNCTSCCTNTLSNILPSGYAYPPEIHFETISVPVTSSDIYNHVYNLLAGAIPELLLIVHQDRASMYYSSDDWYDWQDDPLSDEWEWPWPGDGVNIQGILYDALYDWFYSLTPIYGTKYAVYRTPWDWWLGEIINGIYEAEQN